MKEFALLIEKLDSTFSSRLKKKLLVNYFKENSARDVLWALYFLAGKKLKDSVGSQLLKEAGLSLFQIPEWLFVESYAHVGDLAETLVLLRQGLPHIPTQELPTQPTLADFVEKEILPFQSVPKKERLDWINQKILSWPVSHLYVILKLFTGNLRIGVSLGLLEGALSEFAGVEREKIASRLRMSFNPLALTLEEFLQQEKRLDEEPYPFCLAAPLENAQQTLSDLNSFLFEWKWDGIRAQLIKRSSQVYLWSRGHELLNDAFPELVQEAKTYLENGVVLDGEIIPIRKGKLLSFSQLQPRLGRKKPNADLIERYPVEFRAYDLLETQGQDIRQSALVERRKLLCQLHSHIRSELFSISEAYEWKDWQVIENQLRFARAVGAEGFIVKRKSAVYASGRVRGHWWKWKVDPYTVDAVLLYAQPGHGRRSNLYTDYTFAVWKENQLVPICKAYSGLNETEIEKLDRWIRRNTVEKFGPVRSVTPHHVFEIAFEGIAASERHKSKIALRFPRILRWRTDKPYQEADHLHVLQSLLDKTASSSEAKGA